ncbi:lipid IV(A) 3-deoxy-D-manno-octulosonic acid transferase [Pseudomonas japonica]|uniref:lipid IV(A) 3-deoxy-D-manno-octulosonic acid transferase n=1 Tax=Pseudomonas japonica TaxID=256466 RepID=UPI0015E2875C|nr:lipid IV(A) 3-deoxy-D-manno-octulosonic acid transferase [Pseudomonas japonica]MBA1287622.1 3-deoxy-D-manno-octulosonic acid transferase [Pseudomonas japonica]
MNRTLYTALFHLGLPLIAVRLWWRARRAPAYAKRIGERFAHGLPPMAKGGLWVHAVSVGESIAAAPLVRALLERYPDLPLTLTCMTPTGSERILALFEGNPRVQHCYLPYDLPWAMGRFLDHVQPRLGIVMETELWPNLVNQCARRGIPVALANGRLSARSARGYARFAGLTAPMLQQMSLLAVQTETEAQRFRDLGARPEAVTVTGSIKFDLHPAPDLPERAQALRAQWQALDRPVWIAASTHQGEDEIILAAHRELLRTHSDALLVLVPRHPERFAQVGTLVEQAGMSVARRATNEAVGPGIQVLLGDTMGELLLLYGTADIAFVGGSLVPNGGHNLLEPAALTKPVLSGPHLFNFQDIAERLTEAKALQVVDDASGLADAVRNLIELPQAARRMGEAGLAVMRANQGALERLLRAVGKLA